MTALHEGDKIVRWKFDENASVRRDDEVEHRRREHVMLGENFLHRGLSFRRGDGFHEREVFQDRFAQFDVLLGGAADDFARSRIHECRKRLEDEFPFFGERGHAREDDEKIDDAGLESG